MGAAAGALLASLYGLLAPPAFAVLLALTNASADKLIEVALGAAIFAICSGPFALLLGVLPGTLLGALGGLLIGLVAAAWRGRLSDRSAALIGLLVAIAIVVVGNLLWGPGMIQPALFGLARYRLYLFWIAGPSVLVLAGLPAVGWALQQNIGRLLPKRLNKSQSHGERGSP